MSERSKHLLLACLTLLGAVFVLLAKIFDTPFQQGLLINLGTAVLLFAALYLLQRKVLDREVQAVRVEAKEAVASVRSEAESAVEGLAARVEEVRQEVAVALDALGDATRMDLDKEYAEDVKAVEEFHATPTAATTLGMLRRANRLRAISSGGLRVQLPGMWYRLRFRLGHLDEIVHAPIILVSLETFDGRTLKTFLWPQDKPTQELFVEIATELKRKGEYPGDATFDASDVMRKLGRTISTAISARSARGGAPRDLGAVIEILGPQWAVTEDGVEAIGNHRYVIERSRITSDSWFRHMREKTWVDPDEFDQALEVARALLVNDEVVGAQD